MEDNIRFRQFMDPEESQRLVMPENICALLDLARGYDKHEAVAWTGGSRTYTELDNDIALTRGYLHTMGLEKGARIGLLLRNEYDFVRLFFAITSMGLVAAPFMLSGDASALAAMAGKLELSALIYASPMAPVAAKMKELNPKVLFIDQSECVSDREAPAAAANEISGGDPAAILFTGGTTGTPKGAVLTHRALMRGAYNGCFGYKGVFFQRYYALIPFGHVFGLVRSLLTSILTGSLLYLCVDMKAFMKEIGTARPTIMALVPALADMLYSIGMGYGFNALGGSLKTIIAGGAPVPPDLIGRFASAGIMVAPGYGLTETANLVSGNPEPARKPSSVGVPYEGQELKIVEGELWIKGDNVTAGYYNDPSETALAMEDGWFKTGDLAEFDDEGYLYITGRIKNLIILGNGENVSPEELESLVDALPYVKDCLVKEDKNEFGVPVIAVEILPDTAACKQLGIEDIPGAIKNGVAEVNRKLPQFKQMAKLIIRDKDFVRNASMKIIR